ncbi:hypothetical protein ACSHFW_004450 [Escherichia coli]|nr:hypothetical protein [Escherichia coli]HAW2297257.1 hypothetical protein [Escherichia coli]HCN0924031.1 hypothetical protein [Escherichia coli]
MLSIIFYTFTFSYFDDAKEHNIIMADYHYLYEASEKTKRHKAVLTGERSLEVVDNDNGSNGAGKKLKNKKMLICINNTEDKNYYYYENYILSAYPFKYNNIGNEILYMKGKKLPQSCQESTNRYILYR